MSEELALKQWGNSLGIRISKVILEDSQKQKAPFCNGSQGAEWR